ncbi:hypothetical protein Q2T46_15740 [Thermoanaerobacterium sp. CMT5567-10]|nr:hypothetical protein [Thermoanaerobacterium sp. CMT5567-10]WLY85473.1 hypothetical protein Q2T46_15740 [Thermoanaerobacterium sp. CMT5567-10]
MKIIQHIMQELLLVVEKIIELLNGKFTNPEFEESELKNFLILLGEKSAQKYFINLIEAYMKTNIKRNIK